MSISAEQRAGLLEAAVVLVGAIAVAGLILVPRAGLFAVIGCVTLWFVALAYDALRARLDGLMLCWILGFPFGYTVLSFPQESSIVTLDRVVILIAFTGVALFKPNSLMAVPKALRRAGLAWLAFLVVAIVSLRNVHDVLTPAHLLFDGFLLPLLLGWAVVAKFDVRRRLTTIHTAVCVSSIVCAAMAVVEMATGQDLLPTNYSGMYFAGTIPRPNGPFAFDVDLATVGIVSFFFLLFLRAVLGPKLSAGRRMLHWIGLTATIGMSLMPMFRSIAITLLLALIIDTLWQQRSTRNSWRVVLLFVIVGMIFVAPFLLPQSMIENRSSSGNVYGRVAQFEASLRVIEDHPLLGVGFANFGKFVMGEPRYVASYDGVSSVGTPHNNLTEALAETGILGFVPYVMIQVLLSMAMWQLRRSSSSGSLVWRYYIYVFLSFWITGLTESTAFSPLTVWYVFVVAVFYKYAMTGPDSRHLVEALACAEVFAGPAHVF
jgi:O-antigen ligase